MKNTNRLHFVPSAYNDIINSMLTFGIEEEVFVTEPERPTLRSMYYLARILAGNPKFYYTHSASNFARGSDLKQGLMSGVELSTGIHTDIESLLEDLQARRQDLSRVARGLIVPVGHLLNYDTPTNTCSLQVHVGGAEDNQKLYNNIVHFLPILPLFTINSPMKMESYYGQSYRMQCSFAVGPIGSDWSVRFQDVILSKRLGTIEIRVCDPCWDMQRIKWLVTVIKAIAECTENLPANTEGYNSMRDSICLSGLIQKHRPLVDELKGLVDFPEDLIGCTASDQLKKAYEDWGLVGAYSAVDNGYRTGVFAPREVNMTQSRDLASGVVGFLGYYLTRLPYYAWKGLVE